MPGELYSDAEQSLKSGGKYMVSASIKAAQFTLKEFDALCRFIARCISRNDKNKIGKQSLKDLMSHGNKVVEIGKEPPKPEEMAGQTTQPDTFSWDRKVGTNAPSVSEGTPPHHLCGADVFRQDGNLPCGHQ